MRLRKTTATKQNKNTGTTAKKGTMQDSIKEATYYFALQMYQRGSYDVALNAFLKTSGYKDSDKYIDELKKLQ